MVSYIHIHDWWIVFPLNFFFFFSLKFYIMSFFVPINALPYFILSDYDLFPSLLVLFIYFFITYFSPICFQLSLSLPMNVYILSVSLRRSVELHFKLNFI